MYVRDSSTLNNLTGYGEVYIASAGKVSSANFSSGIMVAALGAGNTSNVSIGSGGTLYLNRT